MKRTLRYLSLFCILISIPLTLTWATWEGNAGIAAASEFPGTGMYARSDMFPRNTIVDIINLETGSSVRAIITGSSGVPGLVAQLSPDTAIALNIRDGAVVRVRIKIPSPVAERPAAGTIQTEDALSVSDPDVNPEAAVFSSLNRNPVVPLGSIVETDDSPMMSVSDALSDETFDDALLGENGALHSSLQEEGIEEPVFDSSDALDESALIAAETDSFTPTEETLFPEATEVDDVFYDEPALLLPITAVVPEADEETEAEELADAGETLFPDAEEIAETQEESFVGTGVEVTLEPAEPRVPEVEFDAVPIVPQILDDPLAREALPPEPVFRESVIIVEEVVNTNEFPWIEELTPDALYVQIATYSEARNVRLVLDTYGKKYPVCVQRTGGSEKQLLKLLIGPIKKDEYGAVLEHFQKNGFKDAFLKRGK